MPRSEFVHLHVHSEYSLLDGANRIKNLVKACVADEQPALAHVAERVGLSPAHFQRVFQRHAGLSPKRFLQHVTVREAQPVTRIRLAGIEIGQRAKALRHAVSPWVKRLKVKDILLHSSRG